MENLGESSQFSVRKNANIADKTLCTMRQNIRQLNRSMESIQKMIEKSRKLLGNSKQKSNIFISPQKIKQNNQFVHTKNNQSVLNNLTSSKSSKKPLFHKQITLTQSKKPEYESVKQSQFSCYSFEKNTEDYNKDSHNYQLDDIIREQSSFRLPRPESTISHNNPVSQRLENKSSIMKQRSSISPFKKIQDSGKTIYRFSPQKTNRFFFNKSIQKDKQQLPNPQTNKKIKIKARNDNPVTKLQKKMRQNLANSRENILIEDEDQPVIDEDKSATSKYDQCRYKTQYQQRQPYQVFQIQDPNQASQTQFTKQSGRLNLKLFERESLSKQLSKSAQKRLTVMSGREKRIVQQNSKISARNNLVKQLEELQSKSSSEEQRKAKFILKIKKYGFVEKYLSQQQIWTMYDNLVGSTIPELKWPIIIVDQVYHKMKLDK